MPNPKPGQSESDFMGECIRTLRREGNTNAKQRVAICLSKWRKGKEGK